MARKRDEERIAEWKREIELARHFRQKYKVDWVYWEKVYNDLIWGGQERKSRQRRSSTNDRGYIPQVNQLENIVLNIVPDILFNPPIFEFTPGHPAWDWSAAVWELYAKHLYRIIGLDSTLEEVAVDTLITGTGFHKMGYAYEVVSSGYQLGDGTTEGAEIKNDTVFSDDISPLDVLLDYRVKQFEDIRWWAHEVRKPVQEVKDDKNYKNTSELKGTETSVGEIMGQASRSKEFKNRKNDTVVLIEIHDLTHNVIHTIADKHPKFLRKDVPDYGIPVIHQLKFSPSRPRSPYGKSISQSIEEHIINMSKMLYYMNSHTRRAGVSKWMFDRGKVDRNVIEQMQSPEDFTMIGVDNVDSEPIREIKGAPISMDWWQNWQLHDAIVRQLSGVSMQSRGRHEPGVETAFEVAKLQEAGDRRNRQRIKKLNIYIAAVMENLLRIVSDTWPRQRILDAVGIPTELSYMLMPFDKIRVDVKFGSTAMQAREDELRKVMMLSQIIGQSGIQVSPEGFMKLVSNSLGLDFRQMSLLLQQPPQQAQQGGGGGGGDMRAEGGQTLSQVLGQMQGGGR